MTIDDISITPRDIFDEILIKSWNLKANYNAEGCRRHRIRNENADCRNKRNKSSEITTIVNCRIREMKTRQTSLSEITEVLMTLNLEK